jgi:heat shock protein HslJ
MCSTAGKLLIVVIASSCAVDSVATRSHDGGAGAMLVVGKNNDSDDGDKRRDDSSNSSHNSALIGTTSWSAKEVELDVNITAPITLEFDLEYGVMRGNTGCNHYSGSFVNLTEDSFSTFGEFATTRMYCDGLMEQESAYLSFLKGKTFFYNIVENIDDTEVDELVLYDRLPSSDCEGETMLARFVSERRGRGGPRTPPTGLPFESEFPRRIQYVFLRGAEKTA